MLIKNVNTDKVSKQLLLDARWGVVQLYGPYEQRTRHAKYLLSCDYHTGHIHVSVKINDTNQFQQIQASEIDLLKYGVNPGVLEWMKRNDYQYKTLPREFRSTFYTEQQEGHFDNLTYLLRGMVPPRCLTKLLSDHRLNMDWYDRIQHYPLQELNGTHVNVLRSDIKDTNGKVYPSMTYWIVYYGDRPARFINTKTQYQRLNLKNAIRVIEINHNTLAAFEQQWLAFKVYSHNNHMVK